MKSYIVFLAFLVVFSMMLVYNADISKYIQMQKDLKNLAEDCADAGALCISEENKSIDLKQALSAAELIIEKNKQFPAGSVVIQNPIITEGGKGFKVTLVYYCGELFRLNFLSKTSVIRSAEYCWE